MPKYRIRTSASYINEYDVVAENHREATTEGLNLARKDHQNAMYVERVCFVTQSDIDPQRAIQEHK